MAWADVISRGGGTTEYRLVIEGAADEWVTDTALAGAVGDGRTRRVGLKASSLKFGESCDPVRVELSGQGISAEIVDVGGFATASFAKRGTAVAVLDAEVDDTDTTVTVLSNSNITVNDYVHSGHEVWQVTAKPTSTTCTVTRALWDTRAIYHYLADEFSQVAVEILDAPYSFRGRRVFLYGYGDGETGAGTLIWRGVIAAPPDRTAIHTWLIRADPISSLLDQELANDADEPAKVRGIYFPWTDAFNVEIREHSGTTNSSVSYTLGPIKLTGHYESVQALADAVNTEIQADADYASVLNDYSAVVQNSTVVIKVIFDSSTPKYSTVIWNNHLSFGAAFGLLLGVTGQYIHTASAGGIGYSSEPRFAEPYSWLGGREIWKDAAADTSAQSTAPSLRVYLDKNIYISVGETVKIEDYINLDKNDQPIDYVSPNNRMRITAKDAANRYIEVFRQGPGVGGFGQILNADTEFVLAREYGSDTDVDGFRDQLVTNGVKFGSGWTPNIADSDLADWTAVATNVVPAGPFFGSRDFVFVEPVDLIEALRNELRLIGAYLITDSDGKIQLAPMLLPTETDGGATTLSHDDILTAELPRWAIEAEGLVNVVEFRTGYNTKTRRHEGTGFLFRDAPSIAAAGGKKFTLKVEPLSSPPEGEDVPFAQIKTNVQRALKMLSRPYYTISVSVSARMWDTRLGDTIVLTSRDVPDTDGTLGVTRKACLVVGRDWDLSSMQGKLKLLSTGERVRGYAPSAQVNPTYTSNTSGDTWDIGTQQNTFSPSGRTDVSYFAVGDRVRLRQENANFTGASVSGTIDSITGTAPGYVMEVTFDSSITWTPATDFYVHMSWNTADTVSTNMAKYNYVADSNQLVFAGGASEAPANTLGP